VLINRMAERILIADDEPDMTSLLAFNLGSAGFAVTTAHDGSEAFEKARMFLPDAIVLDVRMPELNGLEVCKLLQSVPSTRHIPVLIITGEGNEQLRRESARCGAADYLQKPFKSRELVARLRAVLKREFHQEN
jgi:two-component system alkaline phosphatase synthesis response regulator PhoP